MCAEFQGYVYAEVGASVEEMTQLVKMSNRFNGKVSCNNQNEYMHIIREMEDFIFNSTLSQNIHIVLIIFLSMIYL